MKKNILFLIGSLNNGGAERSLVNLLQLIDFERYNVDLILLKEKGFLCKQLPDKVHLVSNLKELHFLYNDSKIKGINPKYPKLSYVFYISKIKARLKFKSRYKKRQYKWCKYYKDMIPKLEKRYDVAVSYLEGETMFYLVDKVDADRKIAWIHTDYTTLEADQSIDEKYFEKLNAIVGVSELCVSRLKNTYTNLSDKFIYLPNLTSSNVIRSMSESFFPKEYSSKDGLRLVSVGRVVKLKGFDLTLEAAKILKDNNVKFTWFIVGDGELIEELQKTCKNYSLMDCFKFLGLCKNPYPYIKNADIIVQPSRYEGKSMVLDEAKILGKPIVVTNYDTVRDQIKDNEGIIVKMNAQSIANGIILMDNNKEKYSSYLLQREYGNQKDIKKYYDLFEG